MRKTYGVIGGYGSYASLQFQQQLLEETLKSNPKTDEDFVQYILVHMPKNIISSDGTGLHKKEWETELTRISKILTGEVDEIIILCNSLHYNLQLIKKCFPATPLVSLISLVEDRVKDIQANKKLILCSDITKTNHLYGLETINNQYHGSSLMIEKANLGDIDLSLVKEVVEKAEQMNAKAIILGCTDLTIYTKHFQAVTNIQIIDSVNEAVHHIIKGEQ